MGRNISQMDGRTSNLGLCRLSIGVPVQMRHATSESIYERVHHRVTAKDLKDLNIL